jgi:hypothetical protein
VKCRNLVYHEKTLAFLLDVKHGDRYEMWIRSEEAEENICARRNNQSHSGKFFTTCRCSIRKVGPRKNVDMCATIY